MQISGLSQYRQILAAVKAEDAAGSGKQNEDEAALHEDDKDTVEISENGKKRAANTAIPVATLKAAVSGYAALAARLRAKIAMEL